ncbi:pyridoxal phosphate-dependent transferase [Catenaria anguillulae PL171]|uniref:Pyridoxal phosphate-dependent transferase n=1 Tax=Catenaria anguillulae PL171 TaxID=765915 RepID=A0A1Y2I6W5_9FUNG|nr:pyridoxal phosphate-dependent transferase [Catenaria anguillulae PL171]
MSPHANNNNNKSLSFDSTLIHADGACPADGGNAVAAPLTVSTTFHQRLPQALADAFTELGLGASTANDPTGPAYIYSRSSNPTLTRVETILGAAEGAYPGSPGPAHAVCYASGLAALNAALHYYKPRRVYSWAGYHGSLQAVRNYFELTSNQTAANNRGNPIAIQSVSDLPHAGTGAGGLTSDDLILVEYPTNPYGQLPDLLPCANPWYFGGHSDLLAGILVTRDSQLAAQLRFKRTTAGAVPGNLELWLLARSLRTLSVRAKHQAATAQRLVEWLTQVQLGNVDGLQGSVTKVWSAKLPSGCFSPLFSVELKSRTAAQALPHLLDLAKPATSLGGVETLVEWRAQHDPVIEPALVRVSVGLEDADDLIDDWKRALVLADQVCEKVDAKK